jgi:hypothetical protein
MHVNVLFAWTWIFCGLISGTAIGVFFHRPDWLGGYASWPRRMVRLGHISFLGTGLINLGYGLTITVVKMPPPRFASPALIAGAATMPLVCYLSAWDDRWRRLFFVPVAGLLLGTGEFLWRGLTS